MNQQNLDHARGDVADLLARVVELQAREPKLRARDLALALGVSEGALVAARCDGQTTRRLQPAWQTIFSGMTACGTVMALSRNHGVVHEKDGVYDHISFDAAHGIVLNHDIDLRLFPRCWQSVYAVDFPGQQGRMMRSLQFFDRHGDAVHKIYTRGTTDLAAWDALVDAHLAEDQSPGESFQPAPAAAGEKPDAEIDAAGFQQAWRDLQDTHDFFPLLRKYGVSRTQALRLAPEGFAVEVPVAACEQVLRQAATHGIPIMAFVGNRGMVQIHSGPVHRIVWRDAWLNVMDPGFNLHIDMRTVDRLWVVRKPTADGIVTSVECFDAAGELLLTFFGERKPGIVEREDWRALADGLAADGLAAEGN
jgi:putative hemin transport protein